MDMINGLKIWLCKYAEQSYVRWTWMAVHKFRLNKLQHASKGEGFIISGKQFFQYGYWVETRGNDAFTEKQNQSNKNKVLFYIRVANKLHYVKEILKMYTWCRFVESGQIKASTANMSPSEKTGLVR